MEHEKLNIKPSIPSLKRARSSNLIPTEPKPSQSTAKIFEESTFEVVDFLKGNGGLKNSINSAIKDGLLKEYKWVGTVGIPTDELSENLKSNISNELSTKFNCNSVYPTDTVFQGSYKNFCKKILWPTLHYQIPDSPNSKAFEDNSWDFYSNLNKLFADEIIKTYNEDDIIWIHDYHLMLVPQLVRQALPNAKIGFFFHVSFPSSEVFRCFPQRINLLKGLLGSNIIVFQTEEYVRHFQQTCNKLLLADINNKNEIKFYNNIIKINSISMGINPLNLINYMHDNNPGISQWRYLIRQRWDQNKFLIVSRDKFDRIRGLKKKLLAFEMFLKENPELVNKAILIQICLKSSSIDSDYEKEIVSIVDRINSLSSNISTHQPVVFLHQDIDFIQYLALMSEADALFVNSMREGMNLTCHEFIIATKEKKSPLILSEFTGSASIFKDYSLLINPWDLKQISKTIKKAVYMTYEEKLKNWEVLNKIVFEKNYKNWFVSNMNQINEAWNLQKERLLFKKLNVTNYLKKYNESNLNFFLINLNKFNLISNDYLLNLIIKRLTNDEKNIVFFYSNLRRFEIEKLFSKFELNRKKIGIIAENGSFIRYSNGNWVSIIDQNETLTNLNSIKKFLFDLSERLPKSYVEMNESLLKFHTEQCVNDQHKNSTIGEIISHINNLNNGISATIMNENLVIIQEVDISIKCLKYLFSMFEGKIEFLTIIDENLNNLNTNFESIFKYINDLNNDSYFTINFDDNESSNAKFYINGWNEFFDILG